MKEINDINWLDLLGWTEEEIDDLRFVGYSYIKQGHYETALKFFEALVVLSPSSPYDVQILGAIYLQIGDNLTALSHLDRAINLQADHAPTLLNRAKALLMLGYNRQGLAQALTLSKHEDKSISSQAEALLLAYSQK